MKKIIGILVMTLLIGTAITSIGMNNKTNYEFNTNIVKDCNDRQDSVYINYENKYDIFNPPVMTIDIDKLMIVPDLYDSILVDLPEYFNWKDHDGQDWTTPAKHQSIPKGCGSCWLFAAIGAIESVINIREGIADLDIDLSEQYVLSCLPQAGGCNGGDTTLAYKLIISNTSNGNYVNGIIPEVCFPYEADNSIPCDDKSGDWEEYLIPLLEYGNCHVTNDAIKSNIMEKGPVGAYMYSCDNFTNWGYTNHNSDDYFPYQFERGINHAVIIVGWKDDSSIEKGGYWICKNSWGPTFGYDGFFNIEYYSLAIQAAALNWVDYNPDDYDWHPVPKTNGPYHNLVDDIISFEGNAAGEHPPFTYYWDFGDDTTSTEQNPTHSYSQPGEYMVKLTVTDENDNSFYTETYAWIQETNSPPNAPNIDGPTQIKKDKYCWYNITFSDPDGNSLYLYSHVFGLESGVWWGPYPPNYGRQDINYCWDEEGDFIVKAKVKDTYGAESDWTILEVTVQKDKIIISESTLFYRLITQFPIFKLLLQ